MMSVIGKTLELVNEARELFIKSNSLGMDIINKESKDAHDKLIELGYIDEYDNLTDKCPQPIIDMFNAEFSMPF